MCTQHCQSRSKLSLEHLSSGKTGCSFSFSFETARSFNFKLLSVLSFDKVRSVQGCISTSNLRIRKGAVLHRLLVKHGTFFVSMPVKLLFIFVTCILFIRRPSSSKGNNCFIEVSDLFSPHEHEFCTDCTTLFELATRKLRASSTKHVQFVNMILQQYILYAFCIPGLILFYSIFIFPLP